MLHRNSLQGLDAGEREFTRELRAIAREGKAVGGHALFGRNVYGWLTRDWVDANEITSQALHAALEFLATQCEAAIGPIPLEQWQAKYGAGGNGANPPDKS